MITQMIYGRIPSQTGHTNPKPVSRLVQGTASSVDSSNPAEALALFDAVFEMGCTAFDTAHSYSGGNSERILGEWMATRGNREQVFILSKCGHPNQDRQRVTPFDITADLHDSLARLRTEYIDLYLLHRDDTAVPVSVVVETFNEHLRAGKIRGYGGSNWTAARVREANDYAAVHGLVGFAASSPQFSLAVPAKPPWPDCVSISGEPGRADREWYASQRMPLFTWSSVAAGFFTGRFTPDNLDSFTFWLDRVCADAYCTPENFARLERTKQLAVEKELTPTQLALAYVLNQSPDIFALVGSRSPEEFAQNVTAVSCTLTETEMKWLETGDIEILGY